MPTQRQVDVVPELRLNKWLFPRGFTDRSMFHYPGLPVAVPTSSSPGDTSPSTANWRSPTKAVSAKELRIGEH
jgi:hypothetical protein